MFSLSSDEAVEDENNNVIYYIWKAVTHLDVKVKDSKEKEDLTMIRVKIV